MRRRRHSRFQFCDAEFHAEQLGALSHQQGIGENGQFRFNISVGELQANVRSNTCRFANSQGKAGLGQVKMILPGGILRKHRRASREASSDGLLQACVCE